MTRLDSSQNEDARLAAQGENAQHETQSEPGLDELMKLVALTLHVPIAFISIADRDRTWFKPAFFGADTSGSSLEAAFCDRVVRDEKSLLLADAQMDARFADDPQPGHQPGMRFYAGAPLRTPEGLVIGALCAMGREPREPTNELALLELFASQVALLLKLGRDAAQNERERIAEGRALKVHRQFFHLAPELLCTLTDALNWVEISPGWQKALGWSIAELRARSLLELVHPEDHQRTLFEVHRLLEESGHSVDFNMRCEHKDGRWVALSWAWTAHEKVVYGAARDMSAYRAKEEELVTSNARLRALFDAMGEGVFVQDRFGAVVATNATAEHILKSSSAHLRQQNAHGPPLAPLIRRDGSPMPDAERPAAYVLRTGHSVTNRVMGLRGVDGRVTWLSANATPLKLTADAPLHGAVMTIRDISEQVLLQEALEQSLDNFRALVASMPIGVAVSHGRTMRYVNQALVDILGYEQASELEGRETLDVIHPNSEAAIRERYATIAQGPHPGAVVLECRKRDGSSVLVEVVSLMSTFEGKAALVALIRDVTESARAREAQADGEARLRALVSELQAAQAELRKSLGEKETLLKEIHHRVKNNLQVIASLLRLGRGYVTDVAALAVFDDSIARLHSIALIHERLYQSHDLERIEMGGYLNGLVAELLRANTTHHKVQAKVLVDPLFLNIDRCVPIGLIVNELVSNALKHAFGTQPERQPVVVVSLTESADDYELIVRDNGVGLPLRESRDGSLGLRIVASLTKQLRGKHHVQNDAGTTWHILFPKRDLSGDD